MEFKNKIFKNSSHKLKITLHYQMLEMLEGVLGIPIVLYCKSYLSSEHSVHKRLVSCVRSQYFLKTFYVVCWHASIYVTLFLLLCVPDFEKKTTFEYCLLHQICTFFYSLQLRPCWPSFSHINIMIFSIFKFQKIN